MDEYNTNHNSNLSNIHHFITNNKINNYHDSAYIDAFFSYLGSKLSENGKCPTFPLFFETFSGIQEDFLFDISEEYSDLKQTSWFNKNILEKKYEIFNIDIDSIKSYRKKPSKIRFEPHISVDTLDLDSLEVDDIETLDNVNDETLDNDNVNDETLNNVNDETLDNVNVETLDNVNDETLDNVNVETLDNDNLETLDNVNVETLDENDDNDSEWSDISNSDDESDDNELKELRLTNLDFNEIDANSFRRNKLNSFDSYESLSDISLSSSEIDKINYVKLKNFPVQINMIEMLDGTLDNYIEKTDNNIPETEWKSILFQICFGLSVAQKEYDFVHNDLHSSNIMFKNTNKEHLYFNFKGNYFKIPTFGKITKIIDFGRATFKVKNKIFFSDVFKKNGDAEGQYTFPYHNSIKNCKIKPNKSFDLSRLATTIIEHFEPNSPLFNLLKLWASDKYGNFLMNYEDNFDLYKIIARNVVSAIPKNQINKMIFKEFLIQKEDISSNEFIYNY